MKKSEFITMLKLKEAQAWETLQHQLKLQSDCFNLNVEYPCSKWKDICLQRWADLSDLLKEFDIKPYDSNERALLIIEKKLNNTNLF
jgi:hypothetical protein